MYLCTGGLVVKPDYKLVISQGSQNSKQIVGGALFVILCVLTCMAPLSKFSFKSSVHKIYFY